MANARLIGYYAAPSIETKHLRMQLFIDYLPVLFFFGAYFYEDIYFATTVLMVAMPLVLLLQWVITRKLNKIYLASTALVLLLGTATLYFRNPLFLYWKPTVLNWAIALAFLGSQFIGDRPFVQRMMENAAQLTLAQWKRLNFIWVVFFLAVGCINLYVAFAFSEAIWVKFKLFGMFGITIIFVIIQTVWLTMTMKENESVDQSSES